MLAVVFCIASFVVGIAVGRAWTTHVENEAAIRDAHERYETLRQIQAGLESIVSGTNNSIARMTAIRDELAAIRNERRSAP